VDQRTVNELADELSEVFQQLAVPAEIEALGVRGDGLGDLRVLIDGRVLALAITARAELRPAAARDLPIFVVDRPPDAKAGAARSGGVSAGTRRAAPSAEIGFVFADRLSERSREVLRDHGWGWLDRRRGNVRLWAPGVRVDAAVRPVVGSDDQRRVRDPFSPAGRQLALWLLIHPDEPASPRGIAASSASRRGRCRTSSGR